MSILGIQLSSHLSHVGSGARFDFRSLVVVKEGFVKQIISIKKETRIPASKNKLEPGPIKPATCQI